MASIVILIKYQQLRIVIIGHGLFCKWHNTWMGGQAIRSRLKLRLRMAVGIPDRHAFFEKDVVC